MYSTDNEGKSVVAERFIRALKNKTYKYMTSVSNNVYSDKLDGIVNKSNNTYHRTIKWSVDVKSSTYIDHNKGNNKEGPKVKVGNHVRISKIYIFLQKSMFQIGQTFFFIKSVKNIVPWTYVISDLNEGIVGTFNEKKLQKTNNK